MLNNAGVLPRSNAAGYVVGLSAVVLIPCLWQPHVETKVADHHNMYLEFLS